MLVKQIRSVEFESQPHGFVGLAHLEMDNLLTRAEALAHAQKTHTVEHKGLASAHTVAALALEALNRQPEAISEYELYLQEEPNGRDAARAKDKIARLKTGNAPQ